MAHEDVGRAAREREETRAAEPGREAARRMRRAGSIHRESGIYLGGSEQGGEGAGGRDHRERARPGPDRVGALGVATTGSPRRAPAGAARGVFPKVERMAGWDNEFEADRDRPRYELGESSEHRPPIEPRPPADPRPRARRAGRRDAGPPADRHHRPPRRRQGQGQGQEQGPGQGPPRARGPGARSRPRQAAPVPGPRGPARLGGAGRLRPEDRPRVPRGGPLAGPVVLRQEPGRDHRVVAGRGRGPGQGDGQVPGPAPAPGRPASVGE